jgi:hypothetical protein
MPAKTKSTKGDNAQQPTDEGLSRIAVERGYPCQRCGYCGFIEDADGNLAGACPECLGRTAKIHRENSPLEPHAAFPSNEQRAHDAPANAAPPPTNP